jgi:hypothetical protein
MSILRIQCPHKYQSLRKLLTCTLWVFLFGLMYQYVFVMTQQHPGSISFSLSDQTYLMHRLYFCLLHQIGRCESLLLQLSHHHSLRFNLLIIRLVSDTVARTLLEPPVVLGLVASFSTSSLVPTAVILIPALVVTSLSSTYLVLFSI